VEFEQPTRTSAEATAAIGCTVAEIAKSVVFRGMASGEALVVVASGDKVAALVGEKLGRADADFVREATGFAIGGVCPVGFARPVRILLDRDLPRLTGAAWSDIREHPR